MTQVSDNLIFVQAAAFDAWMEHVETAQRRRQLLLRTIARLSQLRLSQAFEAWRSTVSDLQEAYGKAAKVKSCPKQTLMCWALPYAAVHSF